MKSIVIIMVITLVCVTIYSFSATTTDIPGVKNSRDLGSKFKHRFWHELKGEFPQEQEIDYKIKLIDTPFRDIDFSRFSTVSEFTNTSDVKRLSYSGIAINKGSTPPIISGNYKCEDITLVYDSTSDSQAGEEFATKYYNFFDQDERGHLRLKTQEVAVKEQSTVSSDSQKVLISGADNKFTIYAYETITNHQCKVHKVNLISGEVDENKNIVNFKEGWTIVNLTGQCDDDEIVPVNTIRIFKGTLNNISVKPDENEEEEDDDYDDDDDDDDEDEEDEEVVAFGR